MNLGWRLILYLNFYQKNIQLAITAWDFIV